MTEDTLPAIAGGQPIRSDILQFAQASLDDNEFEEMVDTLKSGWLTYGPKSIRFEKLFSDYIGVKNSIAVNSCTSGLHLSLLALGIGPGDEVITTDLTFVATCEVILHVGATPILVDIDDTFNIDITKIEKVITDKTKAIIPVHFGGQPCQMDEILKIKKKYNISIIEDAAHASGSKYKDQKIGQIGDVTIFSFYANKNMTTGEGGIVTTNNSKIAEKVRTLSLHGISKDAWSRFSEKGKWYYEVTELGYKYNFTDIQASLGIHQLDKLDSFNAKRSNIAEKYTTSFTNNNVIKMPRQINHIINSWHLFPVIIEFTKLSIGRDFFIKALEAEGIKTSVHYVPIHMQPFYKIKYSFLDNDYPIALNYYKNIISLPIYPDMDNKDTNSVIKAVNKIIKYYKKL